MVTWFWEIDLSRMRSEGSCFTLRVRGKAAFAKSCVFVRNRPQPLATVCADAVRLSTMANAPEMVSRVSQVDFWRLSCIGFCKGFVCVSDPWCGSYIGFCFCKGTVCASDLWRRSYFGVCTSVWLICSAAVTLAFAEEVCLWLICGVPQECQVRVPYESVK